MHINCAHLTTYLQQQRNVKVSRRYGTRKELEMLFLFKRNINNCRCEK